MKLPIKRICRGISLFLLLSVFFGGTDIFPVIGAHASAAATEQKWFIYGEPDAYFIRVYYEDPETDAGEVLLMQETQPIANGFTASPSVSAVGFLGDADGDGDVIIVDVTAIQRILVGYPVKNPINITICGDIDGDGLGITDATLIQRYLVGIPVGYRIGTPIYSYQDYSSAIEYTQINKAAEKYINNVIYDPLDYSVSSIYDYAPKDPAAENSKPAGAAVTFPCDGTLTVCDSMGSVSYPVSSGLNTIYNVTPGTLGTYILKDSKGSIAAGGVLKPTGSLRMIHTSNTDNVRDLGGWACDGGTVKYGKLFRGGEFSASDAELFHDLLGIRAELNMRWDSEVTRDYSLIGDDVDFKHINGPWYSIGASSSWPDDAQRQILEYVMDNAIEGKPLYFHCSAGADRTGTAAFWIEAILGVSQSDMDKDYELTCFYTGMSSDTTVRSRNGDGWTRLMKQFSAYQGETMRDKVVDWALSIGVSIDKINAFRSAMIYGYPEVLTDNNGN